MAIVSILNLPFHSCLVNRASSFCKFRPNHLDGMHNAPLVFVHQSRAQTDDMSPISPQGGIIYTITDVVELHEWMVSLSKSFARA